MKGLQHNVIEINDPRNKDIEKILVFLKPGMNKIEIAGTRQDAEDILQKVRVCRKVKKFNINYRIVTVTAVILLIITAVLVSAL